MRHAFLCFFCPIELYMFYALSAQNKASRWLSLIHFKLKLTHFTNF